MAEDMPGADPPAPPRLCPHCGSRRILRWGVSRSSQRYRCRQCGRTFNALTGTRYARLRGAELWLDYRAAIVAQLSVRRAAEHCGISVSTALRWRRRIGSVPDEEVETAAQERPPSKPPPEMPVRGVLDFVEWVHAASAIDDARARRERLQGLFGGDGAGEK